MRYLLILLLGALAMPGAVDFEKQVRPILATHCAARHSPSVLKAGIVPGKPDGSVVWKLMELPAGTPKAMPPGKQLPKADRDIIRQWIAEGADWPDGVALLAPATTKDEKATVQQLHARISAASPQEFKPYVETIPHTDVKFSMVPIPGGEFVMGTPESESGRRQDEGLQRKVKIDPFWMGSHEVTWDEYRLFMFSQMAQEDTNKDAVVDAISRPTRPYVEMSFGMGINGFPAISMTQHAANKYAQWLSAKTGHFYRLPTEAEWEYACRAGTTTAYSFGDDPSQVGDYAWFADNSDGKYQKVGTKKPNAWGLYDMHGNVMEWTLDQYDPSGYAKLGSDNPLNVSTQPYPQSVRGGAWTDPADQLRCGSRVGSDPGWKMQDPQLPKSIWYHTDAQGLGFRVVRPLKVPSADQMYNYWNSGVEQEP